MKSKRHEIEDDYIGGQGSLTSVEENALSAYFKQKKQTKAINLVKMPRLTKRSTTIAE